MLMLYLYQGWIRCDLTCDLTEPITGWRDSRALIIVGGSISEAWAVCMYGTCFSGDVTVYVKRNSIVKMANYKCSILNY